MHRLTAVTSLLIPVIGNLALAQQTYSDEGSFRSAACTTTVIDFDREPGGAPISSGSAIGTQYAPLGITFAASNGGIPQTSQIGPTCTHSGSNIMVTVPGSGGGGGFEATWSTPTSAVGFFLCDLQDQATFGPTTIDLIDTGGSTFAQYIVQDVSGTCAACLVFFGVTSPTPIARIRVAIGSGDYVGFDDLMFGEPPTGTLFCFCDGTATQPPCGNAGGAGAGCGNGAYPGGCHLCATGTPSVGNDSLVLHSTQSAYGQPGLYFQGDSALNGGAGFAFGDGLRCTGVNVIRLETRVADGNGNSDTATTISAAGGVSAGDTKRYQFWYRDPQLSPCGNLFNLSNGVAISWVP